MKEVSGNTAVSKRVLDARELGDAVLDTCRSVLNLILVNDAVGDELGEAFEPALSDLVAVHIAPLEERFGAFCIDEGIMTLNETDAARLMSYVIADMKEQIERGPGRIGASEIRETLEDTLSLFALHELRHRTQGIADFSTVQLLKRVTGRDQIAKFDIQADRDAAIAFAAARSDGLHSEEFYSSYQKALFYSVRYFFKIYPANAERQDKVCRVAALLFMLARLVLYRTVGSLKVGKPTTALAVRLGTDRRSIAVFEGSPHERLLVAANERGELDSFISDIEHGRLDEALGRAFSVAIAIGLN